MRALRLQGGAFVRKSFTPGVGEYMRVTAVNFATSTLTVIRKVAPNCLPKIHKNTIAHASTAGNEAVVREMLALGPAAVSSWRRRGWAELEPP